LQTPDTAPRTRPSPIRGRDVIYVTLAIVGLATVGTGLVLVPLAVLDNLDKPNFQILLISTLVQVAVMIAAIYLVIRRWRGIDWRHIGVVPPSRWVLVFGALGGVLLAGAMEGIERAFGITLGNLVTNLVASEGFSWPNYVAVLLLIGIATPLAEELFFRGVVFSWMRTRWRPWVAILLNAAAFGLIHLYYPPAYIILVGMLGAVFALAYERSGSIWLPFALHAGHNSAVVTAIYWSLA